MPEPTIGHVIHNGCEFAIVCRARKNWIALPMRRRCASVSSDVRQMKMTGRQDNIVRYRNQLELLPCYPHATFAILDHAAHTLQFEQETVFNARVNEWVDRMERALG